MQYENGFSTIKIVIVLAIIGSAGWVAMAVGNVYYTERKLQQVFDGVAHHMVAKTVPEIKAKMTELYSLNTIQPGDLPQEYYDNLSISEEGPKIQLSSEYHVTVWLMGPPEGVNPDEEYDDADLRGLDRVRAKLRMDFDFSPSSETP